MDLWPVLLYPNEKIPKPFNSDVIDKNSELTKNMMVDREAFNDMLE